MNKSNTVNIEGSLPPEALRILRGVPGINLVADRRLWTGGRGESVIRAGDVAHAVEIKTMRTLNAAAARRLAEFAQGLPDHAHLLLISESTTQEARKLLGDEGVAVIDGLGNMRVELPGMFIWAEGRKPAAKAVEPRVHPATRLAGRAGVAVQALLLAPRQDWRVTDLAFEANISTALAHRVLTRLEREGLVMAEGAGPRRVRRVNNPTALLDLWAEEMRDRRAGEIRAFRLTRSPREQVAAVGQALERARICHAITGAGGAAQLAPFITAIPVIEVWVTETAPLEDAVVAVGAEEVVEGHNLVLRQTIRDDALAFRQKVGDTWLANNFRLYFDLRHDPRRGREQADRLREEVIGF